MISQQTIQQILSRIDIIEIVGGFVKLKRRGTNYLGLCPFHNEKTPSFTVSPAKEIYKCFGCGRSGNTISFLMEHEKYSYVEALRWLAARYNVEIEEKELSPEARQQQQVADSLYIINAFAQKFFSDILFTSEEGQDIGLSYLKERGFNEEIMRKFQLGYCPDQRDHFARAALTAQYNPDYLIRTGLVVQREEKLLDNYRGRIIFPVHNQTGKVIGFGARIIRSNDRAPKYINTPENEIYVKSKILYGSYQARQAIDKADECLLVEGYTDVISLHQAGIENVVASGGTSLTIDQLRLIRKYTHHLTIIYDGDSAGVKAALRGLDMALEEGLDVKLVLIPDKEDPDSYVRRIGATAFREFIAANKKDFILFQLEVALKDAANDSNKKAAVVNQVAETISRINKAEDFTRQQDYIRQSAEILHIEETGLHTLVNKYIRERITKQENKAAAAAQATEEAPPAIPQDEDSLNLLFRHEQNERGMIRVLLEYGLRSWDDQSLVADYILSESAELADLIDNKRLLMIIDLFRDWYQQGLEPTSKNFLYHEDQELSTLAVSVMDVHHELSPNWKEHYEGKINTPDDLYKEDVESVVRYLRLRKIQRLIQENQVDMQKSALTYEEWVVLYTTHKHLKEMEMTLLQSLGTVIVK
ncbi:MAG TPA: DNA primase [Puia sp.]|jgi:DNA primase|nr:DNA primase [Puia sp.]